MLSARVSGCVANICSAFLVRPRELDYIYIGLLVSVGRIILFKFKGDFRFDLYCPHYRTYHHFRNIWRSSNDLELVGAYSNSQCQPRSFTNELSTKRFNGHRRIGKGNANKVGLRQLRKALRTNRRGIGYCDVELHDSTIVHSACDVTSTCRLLLAMNWGCCNFLTLYKNTY